MSVYVEAYPIFACTGSSSFPPPLSPAQEEDCLRRMLAGEKEAQDQLIEHNLRLVAHIVKKYALPGKDTQDLISTGTIGLIKAVQSFHPGKNTRLGTYAARCIENEILMLFRAAKKSSTDVSLQDPIRQDKDGNEVTLLDTLSRESVPLGDHLEQACLIQALQEALTHLPERQKEVLILRYGLDGGGERPQREVAKRLGISRSYSSRNEKRALETLKASLAAEDLLD